MTDGIQVELFETVAETIVYEPFNEYIRVYQISTAGLYKSWLVKLKQVNMINFVSF